MITIVHNAEGLLDARREGKNLTNILVVFEFGDKKYFYRPTGKLSHWAGCILREEEKACIPTCNEDIWKALDLFQVRNEIATMLYGKYVHNGLFPETSAPSAGERAIHLYRVASFLFKYIEYGRKFTIADVCNDVLKEYPYDVPKTIGDVLRKKIVEESQSPKSSYKSYSSDMIV